MSVQILSQRKDLSAHVYLLQKGCLTTERTEYTENELKKNCVLFARLGRAQRPAPPPGPRGGAGTGCGEFFSRPSHLHNFLDFFKIELAVPSSP